jgi:hypothetical protein
VKRLSTLAGRARDEDDATAVVEPTNRRSRRVENRVDILGHRSPPLFIGHVGERDVVNTPDPGVANEEVEPSERQGRSVDELSVQGRVYGRLHWDKAIGFTP